MMRKRIAVILTVLLLFPLFLYLGSNAYALWSARGELSELDEVNESDPRTDAILVLGAGVRSDGTPSHMLEDRLLTAYALYEKGLADAIIVSGDHGQVEYDEVNVMKNYLIGKGVPSDRIFMDHAGFSTYDSVYRAKAIFGADSLLIVTQKYHSYRALMIGKSLGLDCRGVAAPILSTDAQRYQKQAWYSFRESIARTKDFINCILRPEPEYLGESISLEGSGDVTNDR